MSYFEDAIFCRFFSLHFFADYSYIKNMESQENSSTGIYKVLILWSMIALQFFLNNRYEKTRNPRT